jgi:replicative DNA helicase
MKKENNVPIIISPEYGKVPPQEIEAERAVLGTCLVYPDSINEVKLRPEMFYKEAHQNIFACIVEQANKGFCDMIAVSEALRKRNQFDSVGGSLYLLTLTSNIFTNQMIQNHSLLVKQTWIAREYIRIGQELVNRGFTDDIADINEYAESSLFQLSNFTQTKEPRHISLAVNELLQDVEKIYNKEKSLIGIPAGYTSIDRITGGWQPGSLIILAGRPSMGKTALALALAKNPASLGYPVGVFSLEMSDNELATRYLSGCSGYSNTQIRNARVDLDKLCDDSHKTANLPIYIDDTAAISLFELRSKVKKLILKYGVKMIIIDYLQLITAEAGNREQEVSKISRGLKGISKEFNIPVIALSQLNRSVEDRPDKKPRLSDLRESGAIEQDADIVCFVYRPAYYNLESITIDNIKTPSEGLLCVYCEKNRNGALFSVGLNHNSSMTVINEYESNFAS